MTRFAHCCLFVGLSLISGCAAPAPDERVGVERGPILGGALDTTHSAVVAVLGADFECTGTIVQVKGAIGYVLTAAHCCDATAHPLQVVMGNDYNSGVPFPILSTSVSADPCYQGCPGSTD